MESTLIHVRIHTISVGSTTLHFWREKPLLLKLMVSSWQNEILHMDYQWFQPNMESSVINTKLKLKTENWIWSISASRFLQYRNLTGTVFIILSILCFQKLCLAGLANLPNLPHTSTSTIHVQPLEQNKLPFYMFKIWTCLSGHICKHNLTIHQSHERFHPWASAN